MAFEVLGPFHVEFGVQAVQRHARLQRTLVHTVIACDIGRDVHRPQLLHVQKHIVPAACVQLIDFVFTHGLSLLFLHSVVELFRGHGRFVREKTPILVVEVAGKLALHEKRLGGKDRAVSVDCHLQLYFKRDAVIVSMPQVIAKELVGALQRVHLVCGKIGEKRLLTEDLNALERDGFQRGDVQNFVVRVSDERKLDAARLVQRHELIPGLLWGLCLYAGLTLAGFIDQKIVSVHFHS